MIVISSKKALILNMSHTTKISRLVEKYFSYKITKEELRKVLASGAFRMSGVAGPFVIRYKNNKPIISERPLLFRMSMTPAAIKGRNSFTSGIKFAKYLADIKEIKRIWQPINTQRKTAWLNLVKSNYTTDLPGFKNTITPANNHFHIDQICRITDELRIKIQSDYKFTSTDKLFIIIVPYNPESKQFEIFHFTLSSDVLVNFCSKPTISLSEDQIQLFRQFPDYLMYTAIIRSNGCAVEWSNTAVSAGKIAVEDSEEKPVNNIFIFFIKVPVDKNHFQHLVCISGVNIPP